MGPLGHPASLGWPSIERQRGQTSGGGLVLGAGAGGFGQLPGGGKSTVLVYGTHAVSEIQLHCSKDV